MRVLLASHFDDVRVECRTPHYALVTRKDLLLVREQIALTIKLTRHTLRAPQIAEQLAEDVAYYREKGRYTDLVAFVYDPESLLQEPSVLERAWSSKRRPWKRRAYALKASPSWQILMNQPR